MKRFCVLILVSVCYSGLVYVEPCTKNDIRISTLQTFEINELTINLYGIPIHEDIEPYSEGCIDDPGILIFHTENKKPVFFKSGNFKEQSILTASDLKSPDWWLEKPYKKILELTNKNDLLIKQNYIGNCGGCFNVLVFTPGKKNIFKGELYYKPDKYSDYPEAKIIQYDSNGKRVREHAL